jgi:hypothetical protein
MTIPPQCAVQARRWNPREKLQQLFLARLRKISLPPAPAMNPASSGCKQNRQPYFRHHHRFFV